jgi:hypothetical protein
MHRSPHARTDAALRIVEQDVESSRRLTQYPEEQRNLTSMVNGVIGRVMHQLSTHLLLHRFYFFLPPPQWNALSTKGKYS